MSRIFWILFLGASPFALAGGPDPLTVRPRSAPPPLSRNPECGGKLLPWNEKIDFATVESQLETGKIIDMRDMHQAQAEENRKLEGTMGALLLSYEGGLKGVWKPNRWNAAHAEVGMYRVVHRRLKSKMIPPTVYRDIAPDISRWWNGFSPELRQKLTDRDGTMVSYGSVQYFVESTIDLTSRGAWDQVWKMVAPRLASDREIYYFVFGQWDLNRGNVLVDKVYVPALIDNCGAKTRQQVRLGEVPFLVKLWMNPGYHKDEETRPFPFDNAITLNNPTREEFDRYIDGRVTPERVDEFWRHIGDKKDRSMRIAIWEGKMWIARDNHPPVNPATFSRETLRAYASLDYPTLRQDLDPRAFADIAVREIIGRRDLLIESAGRQPEKLRD